MDICGNVGATQKGEDGEGPTVAHGVDEDVRRKREKSFETKEDRAKGLTDHSEVRIPFSLNKSARLEEDEGGWFTKLNGESRLHSAKKNRRGGLGEKEKRREGGRRGKRREEEQKE